MRRHQTFRRLDHIGIEGASMRICELLVARFEQVVAAWPVPRPLQVDIRPCNQGLQSLNT